MSKIDSCLPFTRGADVKAASFVDLMTLRMEHFLNAKDLAGCRATAALWEHLGPNRCG